MKVKFLVAIMTLCLFVGCSDSKTTNETNTTENERQKPIITAKEINNFNYTDYALSIQGEKAVENWVKYQELSIQIDYLKKADLSFFNGDKELLKKFISEFKASIPDQLSSNPILSRIIIIETALLKLNENLNLDNINREVKVEGIKHVLVAHSNLNYQINKKLERDKFDKIKAE